MISRFVCRTFHRNFLRIHPVALQSICKVELSLAEVHYSGAPVEALGPGLVVIRGALTPNAQCRLANYALEVGGTDQGGFWMNDGCTGRCKATGRILG